MPVTGLESSNIVSGGVEPEKKVVAPTEAVGGNNCPKCGKTFKSAKALKSHSRSCKA